MAMHIAQPKSLYDRECIYRFLYEIWSDEFSRTMEGMDHKRRLMKDQLDDTAHHFFAMDSSGRIHGCIRANIVAKALFSERLQTWLKTTELADLFGGDKICYISHFAVSADARGKTVASLLIETLFRLCLEQNVEVAMSYCAPPLVAFYYQLGYRPYTENFTTDAGIRIPIVLCARDRAYLDQIQSPLSRICKNGFDDRGAAAQKIRKRFPNFRKPGFSRTKVHRLWARLAHATPSDAEEKREPLFEGLSQEELQLVARRLSEITFSQGEYIYRRGETEQWMGALLSGSLGIEVFLDGVPRISSIISPGEPFGLTGSLGLGQRAASLVAMEDSQAFLFPADFLERICRANSILGFKLAKRLLKTVATRFSDLTKATAQGAGISTDSVRVKCASAYQDATLEEVRHRIESYRFESLKDREGELKRLVTQATIGEAMEFSALDNVGLRDGKRILDLGSGPGITSFLMARHLPSATIIGVEPEDMLRCQAETLVETQGLGGRCRFLKGIGDQIPLADNYVDFAYARLLFQHLPAPLDVLEEMKRVTNQGGTIVILDVDDRTNIIHPSPNGWAEMETRVSNAQAATGGDRHIGRKLGGYMHAVGLQDVGVQPIPITAPALGRDTFFSIVYGFKCQLLQRMGWFDEKAADFFVTLKALIQRPTTFAMTTVFLAYGQVP